MRIEYHIYKHIDPTPNTQRVWGAIGQEFSGPNSEQTAIVEAERLQQSAPPGVSYSVQRYEYSECRKNRPKKETIWRSGLSTAA
ncbi:hypothetical protein DLM75_22200 [Leptospira stimsonii]|uniref:Uncharacterized protein n=1 Tax=Leptospira stimsonii TaxID=2202203 RepID=A0A396YNI8_9LEPT|nr:hypothetical protein [Leptospira stimsonii]RHX84729.1 hypothetical protein DLM75_22200 [Leptospira stimsonii]